MAGCPVCGGPVITDRERGEVVCAQCGVVVAESAVDTGPEWHVSDEREKRCVRTAPLKLVIKADMAVKPEHGVQWRKLSIEDYVKTLAARVGLPAPVAGLRWSFWRGIGGFCLVRIRGFLRPPPYGWRRLRSWIF